MKELKIIEVDPDFKSVVDANNGYCPCAIWQVPDTKCICKDFRDMNEPGPCNCGRYEKIEVDE